MPTEPTAAGREPRRLLVPAWIFDEPAGDYFLVAIKPDGSVSLDGSHSGPEGVATARTLFESIACIRTPGTRYAMIRVEPVPDIPADVHQEAIDTLNANTRRKRRGPR